MQLSRRKAPQILVSFFLLAVIFLVPTFLFAQENQNPGPTAQRETPPGLLPACGADCDFNNLMQLANNIIRFVFVISIPIAAAAFAYAGFLYITAAGNESQIHHAHDIFVKVAIGFFFILAAWLIVYLITSTLLKPDYINILPGR